MGTDVTLIGPRVLPRESEDAGRALEEALTGVHGIRVIKGRAMEVVQRMPGEVTVILEGGQVWCSVTFVFHDTCKSVHRSCEYGAGECTCCVEVLERTLSSCRAGLVLYVVLVALNTL